MGRQKSKGCAYRVSLLDDYKKKEKDELVEDVVDLIIENEKLKKKLRRYENPHTPPSKDERESRTNFVSITGLAVGKRTGYKGATRRPKKPTYYINFFYFFLQIFLFTLGYEPSIFAGILYILHMQTSHRK